MKKIFIALFCVLFASSALMAMDPEKETKVASASGRLVSKLVEGNGPALAELNKLLADPPDIEGSKRMQALAAALEDAFGVKQSPEDVQKFVMGRLLTTKEEDNFLKTFTDKKIAKFEEKKSDDAFQNARGLKAQQEGFINKFNTEDGLKDVLFDAARKGHGDIVKNLTGGIGDRGPFDKTFDLEVERTIYEPEVDKNGLPTGRDKAVQVPLIRDVLRGGDPDMFKYVVDEGGEDVVRQLTPADLAGREFGKMLASMNEEGREIAFRHLNDKQRKAVSTALDKASKQSAWGQFKSLLKVSGEEEKFQERVKGVEEARRQFFGDDDPERVVDEPEEATRKKVKAAEDKKPKKRFPWQKDDDADKTVKPKEKKKVMDVDDAEKKKKTFTFALPKRDKKPASTVVGRDSEDKIGSLERILDNIAGYKKTTKAFSKDRKAISRIRKDAKKNLKKERKAAKTASMIP
ncbi:MAG: hypothetical protein H6679_02060 [Epsilonproteobacteria bacterium]|nr:hypothetical protein [Campylobacterota bacterium]